LFDVPDHHLLVWHFMASIVLIIRKKPSEFEQQTVLQLLWEYKKLGHEARIIKKGFGSFFKILFAKADIFDFHGAFTAFLLPAAKLRFGSSVIFSLHDQEEFQPEKRFLQRTYIRFGTWFGIRLADQVVTTQKMLQYVTFRRFHTLPRYVPQAVTLGIKRKIGKRIVVIISSAETFLRVRKYIKQIKGENIEMLNITDEQRIFDTQNKELLRRAHSILLLQPLRFAGTVRQLALYEAPIISIETPEHQEALRNNASFIPGYSSKLVRAALKEQHEKYKQAKVEARRLAQYTARLFSWDQVADEYLHIYRKTKLQKVPVDSLTRRELA